MMRLQLLTTSLALLLATPLVARSAETIITVKKRTGLVAGALVIVQTLDRPTELVPDKTERRTDEKGAVSINLSAHTHKRRLRVFAYFKDEQGSRLLLLNGEDWPPFFEVEIAVPDGF